MEPSSNSLSLTNRAATMVGSSSSGHMNGLTAPIVMSRISRLMEETADKVEQFSRDYNYRSHSKTNDKSWMDELGLPDHMKKVGKVLKSVRTLQPYMKSGPITRDPELRTRSDTLKAISYTLSTGIEYTEMAEDEYERILADILQKEYQRDQSESESGKASSYGGVQRWYQSVASHLTDPKSKPPTFKGTSPGVIGFFESLVPVFREGSQLLDPQNNQTAYPFHVVVEKLNEALSVLHTRYRIVEQTYNTTSDPQCQAPPFPPEGEEAVSFQNFNNFCSARTKDPSMSWFKFDPRQDKA